jgi:hypothetical protein
MPAPADPAKFEEAVGWFRAPRRGARRHLREALGGRRASTRSRSPAPPSSGWSRTSSRRSTARSRAGPLSRSSRPSVGDKLNAAWGSEQPWRVETIFRTNVQKAYSEGRRAQMEDPDTLEDRPFWELVTLLDGRTSPICKRALCAARGAPRGPSLLEARTSRRSTTTAARRSSRSPRTAPSANRACSSRRSSTSRPRTASGRPGFDWEPDLTVVPPALVDDVPAEARGRSATLQMVDPFRETRSLLRACTGRASWSLGVLTAVS